MPLILDHITAYLVLATIQLFKARRARTWPKATARITAVHDPMTWGGPARDITFAYTWDGKPHTGTLRKVFVFESSAKQYSGSFSRGTDIVIRLKPGEPGVSIMRDEDQDETAGRLRARFE